LPHHRFSAETSIYSLKRGAEASDFFSWTTSPSEARMSSGKVSEIKMVVVGGGGVGKSSLTMQLVSRQFIDEYDPTIEDSFRHPARVDDQDVMLDILDTAGQEELSAMRDAYLRNGKGFLVVYSIISKASWEEAIALRTRILQVQDTESFPMIFVGNKKDLCSMRQVTEAEASSFCRSHGITHFEASAKTRSNVEEPFLQLVREIQAFEKGVLPPKKHKKKLIRAGTKNSTGCLLM